MSDLVLQLGTRITELVNILKLMTEADYTGLTAEAIKALDTLCGSTEESLVGVRAKALEVKK
ncbi:hypothetical protein FRC07_006290, partial [Ceratobasidium sp. 392]